MRVTYLLMATTLLAFAFVPAAAQASLSKCVTEAGHTVCYYPDEPEYVQCVQVDGKTPVCIVDPCGTTMCF